MDGEDSDDNPWNQPLKERENVPLYLPPETRDHLDLLEDEVSLRYRREFGCPLKKNDGVRALALDIGMQTLAEMSAEEIRQWFEDSDRLPEPPSKE